MFVESIAQIVGRWKKCEESRYYCWLCQDKGSRTVWHPKSVSAARHGEFPERGNVYICVVACTCQAGDDAYPPRMVDDAKAEGGKRTIVYPRYHPDKYCLAESVKYSENVAALLDWVSQQQSQTVDSWEPATGADYQTVISNGFEGY